MIIERVQVDDGFLDGLDLKLVPGLNVIIGGRGTGKTSIIELIRFCLGIPAQTSDAESRALEHALSVLGEGRVTVTLSNNGEKIFVTRTAAEEEPETTEEYEYPAVFSQKEIESLGLSPSARIGLIDSFITDLDSTLNPKDRLAKQIGSLTVEIATISKEIESLEQQLQQIPVLEKELNNLTQEEQAAAKRSKEIAQKQQIPRELAQQSSQLGVQIGVFQRASKSLSSWLFELEQLIQSVPDVEQWPDSAGSVDKLAGMEKAISRSLDYFNNARDILKSTNSELQKEEKLAHKTKLDIDDKVRVMRKEIEGLEKGAGEVIKRANTLKEKLASLKATAKLRDSRSTKLELVRKTRAKLLDEFEEIHRKRFLQRQKVSQYLNKVLGPQINVEIRQAAEYTNYINVITSALRGSGIRYNELAPLIAESLSPRELVEAVERQDIDFIVKAAGIPSDRTARLVSALSDARLDSILTVTVEDDATLQLLDGKDYKEIQNLSVGQRCTVVLPMVLEHTDRILIIDQPEDHLDNAFIVDTFIRAIQQKNRPQQMLFSTHNANVPVLGEASRVFVMKSDGHKGYVSKTGALDHPDIVQSISTIMEGGRAAFNIRARFYRDHIKA